MKKVLLSIFGLAAVAVLSILGLAATKPGAFHIERKAAIAAPPATVFAVVNDLHRWSEWSPWEKMDPNMKKTYAGPESGVDASYGWAGNDKVGEGRMTITESQADSRVGIRLEFLKPWQSTNQVAISLAPAGEGTEVVWAMDGTNNYMAKVFSVFMNMDQMIGKDFEAGLTNLKTLAESAPRPAVTDSTM